MDDNSKSIIHIIHITLLSRLSSIPQDMLIICEDEIAKLKKLEFLSAGLFF